MSIPTADNIVFNLTYYNDQPIPMPAETYISRDQAFITNTADYYLRLVSAQIPTTGVPLFSYKNDMYLEINNSGETSNLLVTFPVLFESDPNGIVFLQQFLNGVNQTLLTAHINVGAPGNAPLLIYGEDNEIKLVVDQEYDPDVQFISFNYQLINKVPTLMSTFNNANQLFQLSYGDFGNNMYNTYPGGINYPVYISRSNVTGYNAMQEFLNIAVVSSSTSVNKQQINNNSIAGRILGIVDVVALTLDDITKTIVKLYVQEFPIYCDLLSNGKLSEIDFKLYLVDSNFTLVPLFIQPGTSATCRFEFINKKIVKNYYPSG